MSLAVQGEIEWENSRFYAALRLQRYAEDGCRAFR